MKRFWPYRGVGLVLALALTAGCAVGDKGAVGTEAAAAAHVKAQRDWGIQLDWAGGQTNGNIERMDIYLVEDESQYPEIFEIHGDAAMLVGELPMDTHIGVDADYTRLIGKTIEIRRRGGDPNEPQNSWVMLGDAKLPVESGTFKIEKLSGKWEGRDGDKTFWGTLELHVLGPDGSEQTVRGKLAVHCVTWG